MLHVASLKSVGDSVHTVKASRCQKSPCCVERQHSYLSRGPVHQAHEIAKILVGMLGYYSVVSGLTVSVWPVSSLVDPPVSSPTCGSTQRIE